MNFNDIDTETANEIIGRIGREYNKALKESTIHIQALQTTTTLTDLPETTFEEMQKVHGKLTVLKEAVARFDTADSSQDILTKIFQTAIVRLGNPVTPASPSQKAAAESLIHMIANA